MWDHPIRNGSPKQLGIKALYTRLIGEAGKESFFGKHIGFQEEKLEDMKVSDKV